MVVLLCMLDHRGYSRSNGIQKRVLEMQAQSLGLPIYFINSSWEQYQSNLIHAIIELRKIYQIEACVFGDINSESHKIFEEFVCNDAGIKAYLPLWGQTTDKIKEQIITSGIRCKLSVIHKKYHIEKLLGYNYHEIDFPALIVLGVDVCGEYGEFHTVVYGAPLFKFALQLEVCNIYDLTHVLLCDFTATVISNK